ncbi:MAG: metalloprotease TldD [Hydrogenophilus sp.]|nr:metalloprotease TldD [Hydrogenophilus sp.]
MERENLWLVARERLWQPWGWDEKQAERVLNRVVGGGVEEADLFFQYRQAESWFLEEGIVKSGSFSIDAGVGVRAIHGEKQALAYTDALEVEAVEQAATTVRAVAKIGGAGRSAVTPRLGRLPAPLYEGRDPSAGVGAEEKVALLQRLQEMAVRLEPRLDQVMAQLSSVWEAVIVVRSDGALAVDVRPLVRLSLTVIAVEGARREVGSAGMGGRYALERFDERALTYLAERAVRQAQVNLEARPAPAGVMSVVLGPGWPGVLLHEAVGHGLEGDFNRKGVSAYSGRIGETVAAQGVTVVDDGTLAERRGSLTVDDEGTPTQETVLIENGVLVGYLQDRLNARLMGMRPTGNGRRESYAHLPLPRMTNTFLRSGPYTPEEVLGSLKQGIYAVQFGGGQVDITSGKFVFEMSEAYWVEEGRILYPVKGATLIGDGPEVMRQVTMVANDWALDPGVGTCGKDGQVVPVGVGQPTVRIERITVGGRV